MARTKYIEDRDLLMRDLLPRMQYGVVCEIFDPENEGKTRINEKLGWGGIEAISNGSLWAKPYLRPLSSLTDEEKKHIQSMFGTYGKHAVNQYGDVESEMPVNDGYQYHDLETTTEWLEYLYSIHADVHGLIKLGLAYAVTDDVNPYKDIAPELPFKVGDDIFEYDDFTGPHSGTITGVSYDIHMHQKKIYLKNADGEITFIWEKDLRNWRKKEEPKLEDTCKSEVCGYRGKGVCKFTVNQYCPMYTSD